MLKWEYCAINGVGRSDNTFWARGAGLWNFTTNGTTYEELQNVTAIAKAIAVLGHDGWEMVGIGSFSQNNTTTIYFKRPIE